MSTHIESTIFPESVHYVPKLDSKTNWMGYDMECAVRIPKFPGRTPLSLSAHARLYFASKKVFLLSCRVKDVMEHILAKCHDISMGKEISDETDTLD